MKGTLAIIGPGVLGRSLAGWAAIQGFDVRLAGRDLDHANVAKARVEQGWVKALEKGRLTQEDLRSASLRLNAFPSWSKALDGADILFEALPENLEIKAEAWRHLHGEASPATLRFTGSSSLPIGALASSANLEGLLLGFHLFVPVDRMKIVELVIPNGVPPSLSERASGLGEALGLRVVRVKDVPGYAASRMALVQGLEAMRLLEAGVASAEDLDALMVMGYGHPVGPLALSDRIGLDLRLTISEGLYCATGDARYAPPEILRAKVSEGALGMKTGRGFYLWEQPGDTQ